MLIVLSRGFMHLGAGLSVGLAGLAAGYTIGIVGDIVCGTPNTLSFTWHFSG